MAVLLGFFFICMLPFIFASVLPGNVTFSSFHESFSTLFGDQNLHANGGSVQISLSKSSGSGFRSRLLYDTAFFSASIKLPANYNTAGVVVAFYTSNADVFKANHDELDFEFLGNVPGQGWLVQTNLFGNESVKRGREERYKLWFNPTQDFHTYSILWNKNWIIFYVDDVPIRQVRRVDAMGGDYPSKPMSLYATIWDGSNWATGGGKHKINYGYAPFKADFTNFVINGHGCSKGQIQQCKNATTRFVSNFNGLRPDERNKMKGFRKKYMIYSHCQDRRRYPFALPECTAR
ncbi:hypothetical protein CRYUN_Cryun23aG0122800 [Craigia yunnanensis]